MSGNSIFFLLKGDYKTGELIPSTVLMKVYYRTLSPYGLYQAVVPCSAELCQLPESHSNYLAAYITRCLGISSLEVLQFKTQVLPKREAMADRDSVFSRTNRVSS